MRPIVLIRFQFARQYFILGSLGVMWACSFALAAEPPVSSMRETMPDTWSAVDALGRTLPSRDEVGAPQDHRTVGIFYFNWQASFVDPPYRHTVVTDICKLLADNPTAPAWGPPGTPHYWSEPRFGYYHPADPWVIRKHVQMLADAGVDVLILDATNGFTYDQERAALCQVIEQMQQEGRRTPQIAMFANAQHVAVVKHLWETFYKPGRHRNCWFQWKGKPLLLTPSDGLSEEIAAFFTIRQSWAWTRGAEWFGDGRDKWPWLDFAPQIPGWHESPTQAECVPVVVAQHATTNIGRSFQRSQQPAPDACQSELGLNFDEQWRHALPRQPEFIFITGWNEWIAGRFLSDGHQTFLGRTLPAGETFFVDAYSPEFSRDIEPMRGGFGDNYYWQMVANIRRYRGVRAAPAASALVKISIPGDWAQWNQVEPRFYDDLHDTFHRDFAGVAGAGRYTNHTGRNDIVEARVAHHEQNVFFLVQTREDLTPSSDRDWMVLLLNIDQNLHSGRWGYDFRVNHTREGETVASIEKWNGTHLERIASADIHVGARGMQLRVPKSTLGRDLQTPVRFDFKWTDNVPADADASDFLDVGDVAPNARFNYVYHGQP